MTMLHDGDGDASRHCFTIPVSFVGRRCARSQLGQHARIHPERLDVRLGLLHRRRVPTGEGGMLHRFEPGLRAVRFRESLHL